MLKWLLRRSKPVRDEAGRFVSSQRQLMLMKARAIRAAKGLPESEALNG